jgi:hypothetical protein
MPDKKATYRIDENLLRKTLLGYSVEVDAAKCSAIESEASALRMQKSIVLPDTKVLIRYVAIPLLLIVSGIILYSNKDSIQTAFTPAPEVQTTVAKKIAVVHSVVKPPVLVAAKIVPPPVVNNVVLKKDSVIVANKTPDTANAKKQNSKQALPVVAGPPTDTVTSPKTAELAKANKVDSASKKSDAPVKKKKKRRRKSNNIDDLKESTMQPNSADDDVVVPQ